MRFGVVLGQRWLDDAVRAEELGFDLVWIDEAADVAPLVVAAAVGAVTNGIRIAASLTVGAHPLRLAEDASVADLSSGGRLVLALGGDDEGSLAETVDVLFSAFAARPFSHDGEGWRIPARLPEHESAEERVRMTPSPAQLEPTIWLTGAAAPKVARSHGLSFADGDAAAWAHVKAGLGPAAGRLRRIGRYAVLGTDDLVRRLRADQDDWGLDVAVLRVGDQDVRDERLCAVAHEVRPRLQLDRLPDGLDEYWRSG